MTLAVKSSGISGRGVYTEDPIRKGQMIHRMGGERVSLLVCAARIALGRVRLDDPLPIRKYEYLVLDDFSLCFNHSCAANAGLVKESDLVALVDIAPGEEITFDYSLTMRRSFYSRFWSMPCGCRAGACRGWVGDIRSVPLEHLRRYVEAGALQDFIWDGLNIRGRKPARAL
jgi:SET domain-containing protein